ncbi:MAG: dicarboxylate/amino acid:cation symporter [Methylococcales bacterium]|jgi:Na+/H+-dicarboxylate symporter|nr:dicarboxylate/amino acid:cation symporter [Methylococcales bacterium]
MSQTKRMSLTVKVLVGMGLGILVGLAINISGAMQLADPCADASWIKSFVVDFLFTTVGTMFVNALKMLVVPLVFFSLICGVCGIGNISTLGRVGGRSFVLYMATTAIAIALSIMIAVSAGIGNGMSEAQIMSTVGSSQCDTLVEEDGAAISVDMAASVAVESDAKGVSVDAEASVVTSSAAEIEANAPKATFDAKEAPPLSQVLIDIIPSNPIQAMAEGKMLQIIFFSILLGISILMVGERAKGVVGSFEVANEIMMKMVNIIMAIAPYAVFALIAKSFAILGFALLGQLVGYVAVLVGALMVHLFITLMLVLKVFSGLNPVMFLKKMRNTQIFAFSTASSNATIPITLRTVTQRLGVDNSVASFTVPFGATINMDGTAIMQGVATVFIANVYGVDLGITGYLTVILMSVLASVGTAGVPGVGLIMLSMVFAQVGLPVEGIALVIGVDRLMDMIRTSVNVSGDAVVSSIVAKWEGKLNPEVFNDEHAGAMNVETDAHIAQK